MQCDVKLLFKLTLFRILLLVNNSKEEIYWQSRIGTSDQ